MNIFTISRASGCQIFFQNFILFHCLLVCIIFNENSRTTTGFLFCFVSYFVFRDDWLKTLNASSPQKEDKSYRCMVMAHVERELKPIRTLREECWNLSENSWEEAGVQRMKAAKVWQRWPPRNLESHEKGMWGYFFIPLTPATNRWLLELLESPSAIVSLGNPVGGNLGTSWGQSTGKQICAGVFTLTPDPNRGNRYQSGCASIVDNYPAQGISALELLHHQIAHKHTPKSGLILAATEDQ